MPSSDDLAPVADGSAFIFVGFLHGTEATKAVVSVEEVIKVPVGLRGLAGREVTVELRHPLAQGHYTFFADPVAVGSSITVREIAHLHGRERHEAEAAMELGYVARLKPRLEAAFLAAIGTVGDVSSLVPPHERQGRITWAMARFEVERILKGKKPRQVVLVGPLHGTKLLQRTPALRTELHALLILQRPPKEALDRLPEDLRPAAAFIADTSDIQPPDRFESLARFLGSPTAE